MFHPHGVVLGNKLAPEALEQAIRPEGKTPLIADKGYDSNKLGDDPPNKAWI